MKKRPYNFQIRAQADGDYEISIRGIIGTYLDMATWTQSDTQEDVLNELNKIPAGKKIAVRINSIGGSVEFGLGIYNALKRRAEDITTYNDGYAFSAASIILLAGSRRVCPSSSLTMIHRATGGGEGTCKDMHNTGDLLAKIDEIMSGLYAQAGGKKSKEEFLQMMDDTTWLSGEQALELGLATECGGETMPDEDDDAETAKAELAIVARYKNTPTNLLSRLNAVASAVTLPPTKPNHTPTKNMKNIINALVAAGYQIPADADESAVLHHITALITDRANLRAETKAFAEARDARVSALVEAAITDKIIAESRKPALLKLGQHDEAEVIAQIAELRAAKVERAPRGAKPGKFVAEDASGEEIAAKIEENETAMYDSKTPADVRANLIRENLKLRGLDTIGKTNPEKN